MLIDESRFFWKTLISRTEPLMDLYRSVRPVIFLPFNIWLYFVTLPFRLFMSISSGSLWKSAQDMKEKTMELKDKALEIKEDIKEEFNQSQFAFKSRPAILSRPIVDSAAFEYRQASWIPVEQDKHGKSEDQPLVRRRSPSKKQEAPVVIDEAAQLKGRISEYEQRERSAIEDKQRLEAQLKDLSGKFESDEAALASFEKEKRRFRTLINMEQKKCFDFQQQIIALKSQLDREHKSLENAESKIELMEKTKHEKRAAKKFLAEKKEEARPVEHAAPAAHVEETHGWHQPTQKVSYTEMVAEAQREELESGKKFSEVLKEALKKDEPVMEKTVPEFIVIGGPQSSQHVVENIRAPVSAV